jgi:hypothetical protein
LLLQPVAIVIDRHPVPEEIPMASSKRELIEPNGDKRYVRRDEDGKIQESDDVGRALSQDRKTDAKTPAKPGQGDRGDRKA